MSSTTISLDFVDNDRPDAELYESIDASNVFQVKGLDLYYGTQMALHDINLNIQHKGITGLIGPSGCGKTSFLYCLARLNDLVERCRINGQIYFETDDIYSAGFDVMTLRKKIGFVFQKPSPFPLSIYKNLELPLREQGLRDNQQIEHIIHTTLQKVGLWKEVKDRLYRAATSLSGGQQQRLCIARALVLKPRVLLVDEPCSALDPISSGVVEELIQQLGENHTVVLVTHNLAQARRVVCNVAFFWVENGAGVLVENGPTDQLFTNPQNPLTAAYVSGARG